MFNRLSAKLSDILQTIRGKSVISEKNVEDTLEQVKIALLEADVNLRVVRRFLNATLEEAKSEKVLRSISPGQQFIKILHDRLARLLGDGSAELNLKAQDSISLIILVGLQGSGKTTTAAKLADRLQKEGRRPLLVAADLQRPAAIEQLQTLGDNIGVPVYANKNAGNSLQVAQFALKEAKKHLYNTIIVDTAGRMTADSILMKELANLHASLKPSETLLVADSMTGQHAVEIAKNFSEALDITGYILSKFDSDTRGGAALSLKSITGKPIKFIGTGEKIADLELFHPERMASRILGMGDIVSLVEQVQSTIDAEDKELAEKKLIKKSFTLEDYLGQFKHMKKMGGIGKVLDSLPSVHSTMLDPEESERTLIRKEAIILSMTIQERQNYRIIGTRRRRRIAQGSGRPVHEVNKLLKEFEKMCIMLRKTAKNKKYQQQLMQQIGMEG